MVEMWSCRLVCHISSDLENVKVKTVHNNKKPVENIYTLKQDLIICFIYIMRQTLKST